jgi:hypothetical protein
MTIGNKPTPAEIAHLINILSGKATDDKQTVAQIGAKAMEVSTSQIQKPEHAAAVEFARKILAVIDAEFGDVKLCSAREEAYLHVLKMTVSMGLDFAEQKAKQAI